MRASFRSAQRARGVTWDRPYGRGRASVGTRLVGSLVCAIAVVAVVPTGTAFAATYNPATDVNSMKALTQYTGATAWWNAGYTGAGVDVAVIDTGVSPVDGTATALARSSTVPTSRWSPRRRTSRNLDTNGHGTFMAGLIAGHDTTPDGALCERAGDRPTGGSPPTLGSSASRWPPPTAALT